MDPNDTCQAKSTRLKEKEKSLRATERVLDERRKSLSRREQALYEKERWVATRERAVIEQREMVYQERDKLNREKWARTMVTMVDGAVANSLITTLSGDLHIEESDLVDLKSIRFYVGGDLYMGDNVIFNNCGEVLFRDGGRSPGKSEKENA